jgi:hypothetical protein
MEHNKQTGKIKKVAKPNTKRMFAFHLSRSREENTPNGREGKAITRKLKRSVAAGYLQASKLGVMLEEVEGGRGREALCRSWLFLGTICGSIAAAHHFDGI